jgi:putative transposase
MGTSRGVSGAASYARVDRSPSAQQRHREFLTVVIRFIHEEVKQRSASPQMYRELKAHGYECRLNTVAELMRVNGIAARGRRRYRHTTDSNHPRPVAETLLDRRFEPGAINRRWLRDITFLPDRRRVAVPGGGGGSGSRLIVGWSMSETVTNRPMVGALEMGWTRRHPGKVC